VISATLIVRDEAAVIGDCLRSIRDHVDEMVVVDTGSRDETPRIAEEAGARLFHFPWIDDFAAARNHALDVATGDWVLYIDADERLVVPESLSLAGAVADPRYAAVRVRFQPHTGYSDYSEVRLFRRDPRLRFAGRIHETIVPMLTALCQTGEYSIGQTDIRITHVGYEGDLTRKHHRNLPLLRKAVIDNPARVYYWWHLGATLAGLGRFDEADATLVRAIEVAASSANDQHHAEASLAYQGRARIAFDRGDPAAALRLADEGLRKRAQDHSLKILRARALIELGREEEALDVVDDLQAAGAPGIFDPAMAFDLRIFGEFAEELRGWACFRLGRFAESAAAYARAAELTDDNLAYRAKAAVALTRARGRGV
jgi:glycosyltransferase involved in cell wall biosynthesis